jgi:hypothetical protein
MNNTESKPLYRRLRWYERRKEGDEWLHWPSCDWVPVIFTDGMLTLKRTIRRKKQEKQ